MNGGGGQKGDVTFQAHLSLTHTYTPSVSEFSCWPHAHFGSLPLVSAADQRSALSARQLRQGCPVVSYLDRLVSIVCSCPAKQDVENQTKNKCEKTTIKILLTNMLKNVRHFQVFSSMAQVKSRNKPSLKQAIQQCLGASVGASRQLPWRLAVAEPLVFLTLCPS